MVPSNIARIFLPHKKLPERERNPQSRDLCTCDPTPYGKPQTIKKKNVSFGRYKRLEIISNKISELLGYLPQLFTALVIFILGLLFANFVKNW